MNRQLLFALLMLVMLAAAGIKQICAQSPMPLGTPPTPEMLEEIIATRGTAMVTAHPEVYAVQLMIPVTGGSRYFHYHKPPTRHDIEAFGRTRGAALAEYWSRIAVPPK